MTRVNHRGRPPQEMHLSEHASASASILSLPPLMDVREFRKVQMDNGQTPFSGSRVISWRSLNYTFAADLRRRSCRLSEACQRAGRGGRQEVGKGGGFACRTRTHKQFKCLALSIVCLWLHSRLKSDKQTPDTLISRTEGYPHSGS